MMLALLLFLDLTAALPDGPLTLTPGKSFGPIALGMTQAEMTRLGARNQDGRLTLGPLTVSMTHGRVAGITGHFFFSEKTRFRIGPGNFQLEWQPEGGHTGREMVKLFAGCGKKFRLGSEDGLVHGWNCRGVQIKERLADGDPEIEIYIVRR